MQPRYVIRVVFGDHIKLGEVAGMQSALMSCGNVTSDPDGRTFSVETYREGKREHLLQTLKGWEQWGFVRWEQVS
jgi:hypothetical protein